MNIEEINGAIKEIADTFKIRNQQLKLIEELGELTREISKDIANGREISDETISEIADVNILINQILYLSSNKDYNSKEKLKEHIEYKLQRTIQRINIGYYKQEELREYEERFKKIQRNENRTRNNRR